MLNPIPPLMVKGFGGSSIKATGMGTIEVCVGRQLGHGRAYGSAMPRLQEGQG